MCIWGRQPGNSGCVGCKCSQAHIRAVHLPVDLQYT